MKETFQIGSRKDFREIAKLSFRNRQDESLVGKKDRETIGGSEK